MLSITEKNKLRKAAGLNESVESFEKMIEQVIIESLYISTQFHVWHWQTKKYSQHVALGDFYEAVSDSVDAIAEQYMGCGNVLKVSESCALVNYDKKVVLQTLKEYKEIIVPVESAIMATSDNKYHGVADTIIDIVKEIDKLSYLLTLE